MATPESDKRLLAVQLEVTRVSRVQAFFAGLRKEFFDTTRRAIDEKTLLQRVDDERTDPQRFIKRMKRTYDEPHQVLWINAVAYLATLFLPQQGTPEKGIIFASDHLYAHYPGLREVGEELLRTTLLSTEMVQALLDITNPLHSDLILALNELEIALEKTKEIILFTFARSRGIDEIPEDDYQELLRAGEFAQVKTMITDLKRVLSPVSATERQRIEEQLPSFWFPFRRLLCMAYEVEIPIETVIELLDAARDLPSTHYQPALRLPKESNGASHTYVY